MPFREARIAWPPQPAGRTPGRWSSPRQGAPSQRKISPLASHHRILAELPAVSKATSSTHPQASSPTCSPTIQSHAHVADLSPRAKAKNYPRNGSQGRRAERLLGDPVHSDDTPRILQSRPVASPAATEGRRRRGTQEASRSFCASVVITKLRDTRAAGGTVTGGAREGQDGPGIALRPADRKVAALFRLGAQDHGHKPGGADGYALWGPPPRTPSHISTWTS